MDYARGFSAHLELGACFFLSECDFSLYCYCNCSCIYTATDNPISNYSFSATDIVTALLILLLLPLLLLPVQFIYVIFIFKASHLTR